MQHPTSVITFLFFLVISSSALADSYYPVKNIRGEHAGKCRIDECNCREWQIPLLRTEGRQWGLITGRSLESVERQLKSSQEFEKRYARFFNTRVEDDPLNHLHPGAPTV